MPETARLGVGSKGSPGYDLTMKRVPPRGALNRR